MTIYNTAVSPARNRNAIKLIFQPKCAVHIKAFRIFNYHNLDHNYDGNSKEPSKAMESPINPNTDTPTIREVGSPKIQRQLLSHKHSTIE